MEEKFDEPCGIRYTIQTDNQDEAYKYRTLSPFEFKNVLIQLAQKKMGVGNEILNAGRGNPNFYSTIPRYAFGLLTIFSTTIGLQENNIDLGMMPKKEGIAKKLNVFLKQVENKVSGLFLINAINKMKNITGFSDDELVYDIVISTIGCFYPNPSRVQNFVEPVLVEYIGKFIYKTNLQNNVRIFPTEGASAAIIYIFNSLKYNGLVVKGDSIGILTPIFSPYLEIPDLDNYKLVQVCIKANPDDDNWEIPDSEIEKIGNKKMKAIFICNPTNPSAISLTKQTIHKIKNIIKKKNPNLIIIEDNVYAPFVDEFNDFMEIIPENTIGVYSFSKYFGVTGCRLGTITIHNNNIIDNVLLKRAPTQIHNRYSMITNNFKNIPFIDRLLEDSRQVAEAHTAGLSTPQQVMMSLYAMYDYLDTDRKYNKLIKKILKERLNLLLKPIKYIRKENPLHSNYYVIIDILKVAKNLTNDVKFVNFLETHKNPSEFLRILAKNYGTVLLPTNGFAGPFWGIRASLANLDTDKYKPIGENIKSLVLDYYKKYKKII
jgi:aspartate 4-decarboxylase